MNAQEQKKRIVDFMQINIVAWRALHNAETNVSHLEHEQHILYCYQFKQNISIYRQTHAKLCAIDFALLFSLYLPLFREKKGLLFKTFLCQQRSTQKHILFIA